MVKLDDKAIQPLNKMTGMIKALSQPSGTFLTISAGKNSHSKEVQQVRHQGYGEHRTTGQHQTPTPLSPQSLRVTSLRR